MDPLLWGVLAVFLALTVPRLGAVPMWDSRAYYDGCLMPALVLPFDLLDLNCFGHPSMLYMTLLAVGQLIAPGNAVLLNLTNVGLGCLAIGAFWVILGILLPHAGSRRERVFAAGLFAVWPAAAANCVSMSPDYGVLVFLLLFVALLLKQRPGLAAVAGLFLVSSKESGVLLYGLAAGLFLLFAFFRIEDRGISRRLRKLRRDAVLIAPAVLCLLVAGMTRIRQRPVFWGDPASVSKALKRFVLFDPSEIFFGRYGPAIWVLSFTWILSAFLAAAALKLLFSQRARDALRSGTVAKETALFLLLLCVAAAHALTRFETFTNIRYLLPIAPILILLFVVALEVVLIRPALRQAVLVATLLLLVASNFRTIDPVSRALWGTFSFGRHELLSLTSWTGECCGHARDQLVYNFEYLKIGEIQNAIYEDLHPNPRMALVADPNADWFLAGRVTPAGQRTLRFPDTVRVHFIPADGVETRRFVPERICFVAFPNIDSRAVFQRLRRRYEVTSRKSYERSGYAISVYAMLRRPVAPSGGVRAPGTPEP